MIMTRRRAQQYSDRPVVVVVVTVDVVLAPPVRSLVSLLLL